MKSLVLLSLCVSLSAMADSEVELSKKEVILNVDLSTTKVKLSDFGYSLPLVKVLVPELAAVTLLNHRNEGESAPCLATFETRDVNKVIQDNPAVEKVKFTITLQKHTIVTTNEENLPVCGVTLNETVEGVIRGFKFVHYRSMSAPDRVVEDCK